MPKASPNPTTKTYTSLDDAFAFFNARLFDGRLPACLITMQRSKSAYGYFAGGRFGTKDGKEVTDEIALNPSHFRDRSTEQSLSTLAHEMAHLEQHHFGKPSRAGYHNKQWAGMSAPSDGRTPPPCGRATSRGMRRACAPRPSRNPSRADRPWRCCRTIRDAAATRCRVQSTCRRPGLAERGPSAFASGSPASARPRTDRVAGLATTARPTNRRPIAADDASEVRTDAAATPRNRPPRPRNDPRETKPASGSRPPPRR